MTKVSTKKDKDYIVGSEDLSTKETKQLINNFSIN